jgi:membrane protease YdiL (CAAX protease family)
MHLKGMNKNYGPAIVGTGIAIVVTTVMDASGLAAFSALALTPLTALLWYSQKFSRAEMGLAWGRSGHYTLGVAYPVFVLGVIGLVALSVGAVDTSETVWSKTLINIGLMSSIGILMGLITEEGFFRGWLWATLKRAGQSDIQVLLWTSAAFTAWHISAISLDTGFDVPASEIPVYLVNATLLGLIWGMLRMVSGSILVPSVSHALWNGLDYPLFGFGENSGALGIQETHIFGPEVGIFGIVANLLFAAFLYRFFYRRSMANA